MKTTNQIPGEKDDFQAALTAMQRAAERARERARASTGVLVVWRDGRIVEELVDDTGQVASRTLREDDTNARR
ncbi:hypothetical protein CKO42_12890 [Lamprobacter modestohalophilus]|uniref:Uncharacterized protein n=1 Tax=Lamprobacter modestohalophilus TaxID=1064514 RepID=A0A9X0W942_9GAMM|nr:hypothetical protein [Lamprobacter modestohalophilus]MBK1619317.1 hypothetical protein [Lamprobacter modestohalophilus]